MAGPDFGFVLSGLAYCPNLKSIYLSRLSYRILNRNLPAVLVFCGSQWFGSINGLPPVRFVFRSWPHLDAFLFLVF